MSYEIITGRLITRTALHIGAGEANGTTDALLRRDTQAGLLIPGTALAGALRTIATRLAPRLGHEPCWALWPENHANRASNQACKCPVCHLFGDVNPQEQEDGGDASRLWIANALLETVIPETQIRDGVGIERRSRVAARQGAIKFDLEVLPPESTFTLRLELQNTNPTDEQLLAAALAEWEEGRGTIGGRVSRGLGAFRVDLQRASRNLNDEEKLLAFLKDDKPWLQVEPKQEWLKEHLDELRPVVTPVNDEHQELDVARTWLEVQFILEAEGSFLVNDLVAQAQSGFDHAPLFEGLLIPDQEEKPKPVLPGSSLRGALRSQAERIARTLATIEAWQQDDEKQRQKHFATHCPACDPNARRKRVKDSSAVALESCDSLLLAKGVESDKEVQQEELCLACWLFGSARQGSRFFVEDARFVGLKPTYKVRDFVAIDRFTGGAAEQYKFDAIELWKPQFKGRLRLEKPTDWELGWLLLTLRDLQDGLIPLGFGAAKGMGRVKINQWIVRLGFLHSSDVPGKLPADVSTTDSGLYQVAEASWNPNYPPSIWKSQAEDWVQNFNKHLKNFQRQQDKLPKMLVDTYFGQRWLTEFYPPLEVKKNGKDGKINFDDLISQLDDKSQHYGPQAQSLTILGGCCPTVKLLSFLKAWNLPRDDMSYCLWEEVSRIVLEQNKPPVEPEKYLERGRIFGTGGDLSLRRDGDQFRWWFIGKPEVKPPPKEYNPQDFWTNKKHKSLFLHCHKKTALLWGVRGNEKNQEVPNFWLDDRVARATLAYPGLKNHPERVQIRYCSFTNAGQVMFVWLQGLEGYDG